MPEFYTGSFCLRGSVGVDAGRVRINVAGGEARTRLLLSQATFLDLPTAQQGLVEGLLASLEAEPQEGPNGQGWPTTPLSFTVADTCAPTVSTFSAKDGSEKELHSLTPAPGELVVELGSALALLRKWKP
jgi:hypothetical protein